MCGLTWSNCIGGLLLAGMYSCQLAVYCSMNAVMRGEFEKLGSTLIRKLGFRDVWVFVGQKGIAGITSDIEQVQSQVALLQLTAICLSELWTLSLFVLGRTTVLCVA